MALESVNKELYSSSDGVNSYVNTTLQPPEVSILVKYKDAYYNKKILDIGCGAGRTSHYFRNFTDQYTGVDYSAAMIDYCVRQYVGLTFKHCDVRDLSCFDDGEFDFIMFSYNGIDYIDHNDRIKALAEINRVLKPGGLFVFSAHNRKYKNINTKPSLAVALNPVRMAKNIVSYAQQIKNRRELSSQEVHDENYAILNDSGNNFGLLTYYIDKKKQTVQLKNSGFDMLEMYKLNGQGLLSDEDDSGNCWIYYVCKCV
ncbi:hypothetical protein MNBD_GAMMA17-2076 [hydrothermal vent metagenome]|uniref:Methyltransferase domain-containing protein n=1 Tax=hydrothermal vent metagenome TaxID=652676 RepID=A0A3B0ZQM1_9ZZZZ